MLEGAEPERYPFEPLRQAYRVGHHNRTFRHTRRVGRPEHGGSTRSTSARARTHPAITAPETFTCEANRFDMNPERPARLINTPKDRDVRQADKKL